MWKYTYVYLVVDDETQEKTTKRDYISIVFPFLHSLSFDFSLKQTNTNSHQSFASHGRRPKSISTGLNRRRKFSQLIHQQIFPPFSQSPYNNNNNNNTNNLSSVQRPLQSAIYCYNCKQSDFKSIDFVFLNQFLAILWSQCHHRHVIFKHTHRVFNVLVSINIYLNIQIPFSQVYLFVIEIVN